MTVSLNDKPNRVTVSGDTVTVTAGSGIQGPQGATGPTGAGGTVAFFGNFFSTETQTNASTTAKNTFTLNSTVDSSGISIVDGTKITFGAGTDGTYDLQFSAQFDKTDSGTDEVDIWISKNGTDLEWSNTILSLVGNNAKAVPAWNFQLNDVTAGDFFELHWWSSDSAMRVLATAAGTSPTRPAVPSLIVTVAQVTYTQVGPTGPAGATGATGATGPQGPEGGTTTLTTKGDLLTRDASAVARLPVSTTNDWVLTADSATTTGLKWAAPASSGAPTDATYVTLSTNGTLTNERVLTAGTGISITDGGAGSTATVATSAILPTIVDAKGDLLVGTAADTVARLAVGTNDHVLTADSGATNGVKWAVVPVAEVGLPSTNISAQTYMPMGWGWISTLTTWAHTADIKYYTPIVLSGSWTITSIYVNLSAAGAANSKAIVALYNADTAWQPTTLIAQTAEFAIDSIGVKTANLAATGTTGRFILMWHANGTPTLRVRYGTSPIGMLNTSSSTDGFQVARRIAGTYSSTASSPGTAWTTVSTNASDFTGVLLVGSVA